MRAILLIAKTLWEQDGYFALCSVSEPVREVFEISGFDRIIAIHPSLDPALAARAGIVPGSVGGAAVFACTKAADPPPGDPAPVLPQTGMAAFR